MVVRGVGNGVYPRVCGGNKGEWRCRPCAKGLSPRVRGKRRYPGLAAARAGSIPACAGETESLQVWQRIPWVYPRVCGGNRWRHRQP